MTNICDRIRRVLRDLGANHTDRGFRYTLIAVKLVWETEDNLHPVRKKVYDVIAKREHCHPKAVESAIREISRKAWKFDQAFFLHYEASLLAAPSNVKLLEILLRHLHDTTERER